MRLAVLPVLLGLAAAPSHAADGRLTLFATGESLATEGFQAPELTRDGWALRFDRVIATFGDIAAHRTDPPFMADGPAIPGPSVAVPGVFTVDLAAAGEEGLVRIATVAAPPGHYNALAWSLVPAPDGEFAGYSLVFVGTATRDGRSVPFTLGTRERHDYACGEFVGDARKGFVSPGGEADLQMTLHLDHLFGRADRGAADPMNVTALGFDRFATGGTHSFAMGKLHLGHVGEGHCHAVVR
jgi:hypothetical protein